MACHMGQDNVATELVNCGANINQPNLHGSTPLHLAAASSNGVLCLELLINNGADVNVQVNGFKKKSGLKRIMCYCTVVTGHFADYDILFHYFL